MNVNDPGSILNRMGDVEKGTWPVAGEGQDTINPDTLSAQAGYTEGIEKAEEPAPEEPEDKPDPRYDAVLSSWNKMLQHLKDLSGK